MRSFSYYLIAFLAFAIGTFAADWSGKQTYPAKTKTIDGKIYFAISTAEELAWFINNKSDTLNAQLQNDIVVYSGKLDTSKTKPWITRYWDLYFEDTNAGSLRGIFDGAGYKISGLLATSKYKDKDFGASLFAEVADSAVVKNLTLENISPWGYFYFGGITYYNRGSIINCHLSNNVTFQAATNFGGIAYLNYGLVSNCTNSADLASSLEDTTYVLHFAGIVANNNGKGKVLYCVNKGNISTNATYAGGVVAENYRLIQKSSNEGDVNNVSNASSHSSYTGGIVGMDFADSVIFVFDSLTNSGNITSDINFSQVGGIVGYSSSPIMNSKNTGNIKGIAYVGGIAGKSLSGSIISTNLENTGNVEVVSPYGNTVGMAGGIAGSLKRRLEYARNSGTITGTGYRTFVGGIAGENDVINGTYYLENEGSISCSVTGQCDIGGIAGRAYRYMIHSKNSGTVNAKAVYQTTDTILTGAKVYAGGIIGYGQEIVRAAENFGKITASSSDSLYAGGVSGYSGVGAASVRNLGDIEAHAKYLILGGIAGRAGSLQGSYNVAKSITYTVDGGGIADTTIGALVGVLYSKPTACGYLDLTNYPNLPAMGNKADPSDSLRFSESEMKTETFASYLNSTKADTSFYNKWVYAGDYPIFADSVYVPVVSFKTKATPVPKFELQVSNRSIHILNGKLMSPFVVVDLQGRIMKRGKIAGSNECIQISKSGVYFIKVGSQAKKVLIK